METRQAIEQMLAAIMTNTTRNRRADGSPPTRKGGRGGLRRLRRRPAMWLLAGALVFVPLIALTWNGQWAKAQAPVPPLIVNQPDDAGDGVCDSTCTLRDAVLAANAAPDANTITFDSAVFAAPGPHTINLSGALPDLSSDMTIQGPGPDILTVRRNTGGEYRIFTISAGQTVTISGLTISNGSALLNLGLTGDGGGILNLGALTVTDSVVSGNSARFCGGGICNRGAATVINSRVTSNYSDHSGGGIGNYQGTLTVQNSTVSGNDSLFYGGGVFNRWTATACSVTNSTVSGNHTGDSGGGIFSESQLTVTSSTVSGNNSDGNGGGIADEGTLTVVSATITNNRADVDNNGTGTGGGIFFQYDFPPLRNTIVADNYLGATSTTDDDIVKGAWGDLDVSSSFNLVGTGRSGGLTDGTNNNQVGVANSGLGPLADNGGLTKTHALLEGSPALDAGHNNLTMTDQRGFTRPYDDPAITNASGGDGSDIGAFEVQAAAATDADGDGVPDATDNCPTTANPDQANTDGDAQGDACDSDDDNDGQTDADEIACGSNPLNAASRAPDNDSDNSPDCVDADDDNDGVLDTNDNCQFMTNPDQANTDGDAFGNACDPDDDNDGQTDADEIACGSNPLSAASRAPDNDSDSSPDCVDLDDDNDSVLDTNDNCQFMTNPDQANTDGDAFGNACDPDDDNDGVADGSDNCPLNANANQADNDGDGQGDICDSDDDNDGVADLNDNCQFAPNADQANNDGDSLGNVCDPDDDNDGIADGSDNCPFNANTNQADSDADGLGDACDADDDNDGVADARDNCPLAANPDQLNTDGDALGNVCDPDDDNDGQSDADEIACGSDPLNAASRAPDNDSDNNPDCVDPDDDNDGVLDTNDNCQFVANPDQANSDGDALGNACDPDDDNDGVADGVDNCPLNANANQADNDGDGQGDVCDSDDDNDGVADIIVNSTADTADGACTAAAGGCTLREAITAANARAGKDMITFDIPGAGPHTIQLDSALPALLQDVDSLNTSGESIAVRGKGVAGSYRIFTILLRATVVTISGLTITNGAAESNEGGGGIYNNGTLTLTNSTVSGNTSQRFSHGGGILNTGTLTLTNSTVSGNTSQYSSQGGGIYNGNGTLTLTNSTVSGNSSSSGGGGILNYGTLTLTNSTVSGNFSSFYGGGIFNLGGTLTLTNSTVSGNTATGFSLGGGIFNSGTLTLTNSTVSGNFSSFDGGGIHNYGTLTLINSTVSSNTAAQFGGGILHSNAGLDTSLKLFSTTITNNRVNYGGGGGIHIHGPWRLYNSIVADNYKGSGNSTEDDISIGGGVGGGDFNLIGTVTGTGASAALINGVNNNQVGVANPGLGPLADNGGPTQTHALQTGSPAIDKGHAYNLISFTPLTTDQRGAPRPYDDPAVANAFSGFDIGAFERQPGNAISAITSVGTNTAVQLGPVSVTFSGVSVAGTTTQVSIDPATAGTLPGGYSLGPGLPAYEITTTAQYTPPVTVCFTVPSVTDPVVFASLRILHGEGGALVNRTILAPDSPAPDFASKRICARVTSLSPFVVAQQVVYNFNGFFRPIENLPLLNVATAGSAVPVKFSLNGNQGLAIFDAAYPASSPISCDAAELGNVIEQTVTAGSSSLSYDVASDQYSYVWKTETSWKGTCRMLVVRLNDRTEHLAKFRFR